MQGCSCGTKGCTAREGTRRRLTGGIWRLRGLEGGETDFASQFPPRQLDAYSTPLELITGMSNPKGGNRTPVIRIYYRHIFDAYSASLELISGVSNPKGANRRPVIRIYYRHIFDAYSASGMSNPKGSNAGYQNILSTHA